MKLPLLYLLPSFLPSSSVRYSLSSPLSLPPPSIFAILFSPSFLSLPLYLIPPSPPLRPLLCSINAIYWAKDLPLLPIDSSLVQYMRSIHPQINIFRNILNQIIGSFHQIIRMLSGIFIWIRHEKLPLPLHLHLVVPLAFPPFCSSTHAMLFFQNVIWLLYHAILDSANK